MKKFFLVSFGLAFIISQLVAQVPQGINYQTVVRNSSGQLVKDQAVSLKFSIHLNSATGQEVYSEKHVKTTNQFGIVNLHIGKGTVLSGDFETINWGGGKMFLKTFLDLSGGDSFTEMGTAEMVSVPYALYAGSIYVNYSNDTLYIGNQAIYLPSGGGGSTGNTVTDYDGNVYGTVIIGTQTWLDENLKSAHYSDGTAITGVFDYNNNATISASYGKLYTWDAAMNGAGPTTASPSGVQGVCPTGYHLPSIDEWETLRSYVSSHYEVSGGLIGRKLKAPGTTFWETDNGTNETGFSAKGAGKMYILSDDNAYDYLKEQTYFWSTTELSSNDEQAMWFKFYDSGVVTTNSATIKTNGLSIRCIKD